jgi:hypothetical protein
MKLSPLEHERLLTRLPSAEYWCPGYEARTRHGEPCRADDLTAHRYSLVGALWFAVRGSERRFLAICPVVAQVATGEPMTPIACMTRRGVARLTLRQLASFAVETDALRYLCDWEDAPERTFETVRNVIEQLPVKSPVPKKEESEP